MSNYKKISDNIQQLVISGAGGGKIRWLNIANPGKEELSFLRKIKIYDFDFKQLRASSAKMTAQRPMLEQREKYFFIILHFPIFKNGGVVPAEIDFFISHGLLVTLHNNNISALNEFFNTCRKDEKSLLARKLTSSAILLYEIIAKLIGNSFDLIDKNSEKIDEVEKTIFSGSQKKAASQILELNRNIINFRRIINNHKNMLKKIMEMKSKIVSAPKLLSYYYSLIEQTKRLWEFSESQKETIQAMHDTNESMQNSQINSIMKTLTIVSVIFAPLSFIVALLTVSVNKGMPLLETPNGFWLISTGLGILALLMLLFFMRKKWL
jgi:magnesium transporter